MTQPLFNLGQLVITKAALMLLCDQVIPPINLIRRHVTGDFGDLCRDDLEANLHAIKTGLRVLSKYRITASNSVYVITEADRSSTCILLTEEY